MKNGAEAGDHPHFATLFGRIASVMACTSSLGRSGL
jgi:hypothetical protein